MPVPPWGAASPRLRHDTQLYPPSRILHRQWLFRSFSLGRQVCNVSSITWPRARSKDGRPEHITPAPPFTYTGMDVFGPFYKKEGRKEMKR